MKELITIRNVSYFRNNRQILDNISFSVKKGEKIALLGNNGAGKTTLIDIMTQDIKPTSGEIFFGNTLTFPKESIGVLYGCLPVFPYLKVVEQIKYFVAIYRLDYKKIEENCFERFGIDRIRNLYIYQLSQGERQKLGLLISNLNNPDILIWDEPFHNLDPTIIDIFWGYVNTKEKTIFYSTHNWEDVIKKSTKVCLLYEGKLIEEPRSPIDILTTFPKQNMLIVGTDVPSHNIIKDYDYYEMDGCYYIFWSDEDPILSTISNLTNNFSVKKIGLIDYYRYKTSKL